MAATDTGDGHAADAQDLPRVDRQPDAAHPRSGQPRDPDRLSLLGEQGAVDVPQPDRLSGLAADRHPHQGPPRPGGGARPRRRDGGLPLSRGADGGRARRLGDGGRRPGQTGQDARRRRRPPPPADPAPFGGRRRALSRLGDHHHQGPGERDTQRVDHPHDAHRRPAQMHLLDGRAAQLRPLPEIRRQGRADADGLRHRASSGLRDHVQLVGAPRGFRRAGIRGRRARRGRRNGALRDHRPRSARPCRDRDRRAGASARPHPRRAVRRVHHLRVGRRRAGPGVPDHRGHPPGRTRSSGTCRRPGSPTISL